MHLDDFSLIGLDGKIKDHNSCTNTSPLLSMYCLTNSNETRDAPLSAIRKENRRMYCYSEGKESLLETVGEIDYKDDDSP